MSEVPLLTETDLGDLGSKVANVLEVIQLQRKRVPDLPPHTTLLGAHPTWSYMHSKIRTACRDARGWLLLERWFSPLPQSDRSEPFGLPQCLRSVLVCRRNAPSQRGVLGG